MNITIGIISCNRVKYLKSLIESLKCLKNSEEEVNIINNIQVIVVDNASKEEGLVEYLKSEENKFINKLILRTERDWNNDEYHAKNIIIKEATHDVIFFLQDDLSYIGTLEYLVSAYDAFIESDALCMDMCGVRNTTVFRKINYNEQYSYNGFKYWGTKTDHFQTIGLFKKEVFDECGYYPVGKKFSSWKLKDNDTIQQEDYYSYLVKEKFLKTKKTKNITILTHVPLIITIWNDPRGCYAFIRDNKRYGHYIEPKDESGLYYKRLNNSKINKLMELRFPSGFTSVAEPLGWKYCKDTKGEQEKCDKDIIMEEGPMSDF